jgi:hypothetical protein
MANITKRVNKKIAERLDEGEEVRVAVLVEPKGTYGKGAFALAAAPGLMLKRQARKAAEDREAEGGMAMTLVCTETQQCTRGVWKTVGRRFTVIRGENVTNYQSGAGRGVGKGTLSELTWAQAEQALARRSRRFSSDLQRRLETIRRFQADCQP